MITNADARVVVELTRDRDAWQSLALRAMEIIRATSALEGEIKNWPGHHLQQVREIDFALIARAMDGANGNKMKAARFLGISRTALVYKLNYKRKLAAKAVA